MAYLALIRHGESEWNVFEKFAGQTNVLLTAQGKEQARAAGIKLKHIPWDYAFHSGLDRTKETLAEILPSFGRAPLEMLSHTALNERFYGVFEGKTKPEIISKYGDEAYRKFRRTWDEHIENVETLKEVYDRLIPYYENTILPLLLKGKNVIVACHGNALMALIKYLDNISEEEALTVKMGNAEIRLYTISMDGSIIKKEVL